MKHSAALREERSQLRQKLVDLVAIEQGENKRTLNADEAAQFDAIEAQVRELDARIERAEKVEGYTPKADVAKTVVEDVRSDSRIEVKREALTYEKGNKEQSFIRDMFLAQEKRSPVAMQRLERHMDEVRHERAQSTTDGSGGDFVPPIWVLDDFEQTARAGRPFADVWNQRPLFDFGDEVDIPKFVTGTAAAAQSSEGSPIQNTDATTGTIQAHVHPIAGEQTVSRQVLDRGVPGMDGIYFADLLGAYHAALDSELINRNVTNERGVLHTAGINSVTYTDASPTAAELVKKVAKGVSDIATNLFRDADLICMHPRRWYALLGESDTQGRPLAVPAAHAQNAQGLLDRPGGAEGVVGTMLGLPVLIDSNIPANLGAGTDEDRIVVARRQVLELREENSPRFEIDLNSVGSNLQAKLRMYGYCAFAARNGKGISVIGGTGLVAPTF